MVIVWGSRYMGKTDVVPGLFCVKTCFGHLYYLPLIPLGSYAVVSESANGFQGAKIPLSFKSILLAWVRAALVLAAVTLATVGLFLAIDNKGEEWWLPLIFSLIPVGLLCATFHRFIMNASFGRACQIAELLQFNEVGWTELSRIYGQAPPRGFAIQPSVAPTPVEPLRDVSVIPLSSVPENWHVPTHSMKPAEPIASSDDKSPRPKLGL